MNGLQFVSQQLSDANYSVASLDDVLGKYLAFEGDTVLGFVLAFPDAVSLIVNWRTRSQQVLKASQFGLRRSEAKAWNAYLVLLATEPADYGASITLSAIEEDLTGTRKIARAGVATEADARSALLPLLAMQNAPQLDAVDMASEIRLRTSELPVELIDAFVSGAPEATMLQMLEAGQ
ncbi:hypothetical protein [Mesorhizobium sp. M0676]|uniref:hypothetical protein n=1 Tax=Mesorhizobium sp. M0676 TaxID=2956984 RepID=UPI003334E97F